MSGMLLKFVCRQCGSLLVRNGDGSLLCCNGHGVNGKDGVYDFLDERMHDITKKDAVYHESVKEAWIDINQLNTLRNRHYHERIIQWIKHESNKNSILVELGGGVGYDLELLLNSGLVFEEYVFSEISQDLAVYVKNRMGMLGEGVTYCAIDANHLPFADGEVSLIFMVATLHHLPDLNDALAEMNRVLREGGSILFGIEPNRRMIRFLNLLKKPFRRMLASKSHSAADEEAEGVSWQDFHDMAARLDLKVIDVQPVWFTCGFLHYGLEMLYRLLRMDKRICLPISMEKACIDVDEFLFRWKLFREYAWHYTAILRKAKIG